MYFDGVCNLCNGIVDFLISRPSLPPELKFGFLPDADPETVVLVECDDSGVPTSYHRSDAVLRVLVSLGGMWTLFRVFFLVPRFLRDWVYRFVARNRYGWFGKRDLCRLPTESEKSRFLS